MSVTELRKAAETLRRPPEMTVAEITNGVDSTTAYKFPDGFYLDRRGTWPQEPRTGVEVTRTFHETVRPDLASVLADWLEAQAEHVASHDCEAHCAYPGGCRQTLAATALARAINGAAS